MSHTPTRDETEGSVHRAGAFDIRTFIGTLLAIYGVVLVVVGLVGGSDAQKAKSDNLNINLYAGIGMVVAAVIFVVWARLRPVVVPAEPEDTSD